MQGGGNWFKTWYDSSSCQIYLQEKSYKPNGQTAFRVYEKSEWSYGNQEEQVKRYRVLLDSLGSKLELITYRRFNDEGMVLIETNRYEAGGTTDSTVNQYTTEGNLKEREYYWWVGGAWSLRRTTVIEEIGNNIMLDAITYSPGGTIESSDNYVYTNKYDERGNLELHIIARELTYVGQPTEFTNDTIYYDYDCADRLTERIYQSPTNRFHTKYFYEDPLRNCETTAEAIHSNLHIFPNPAAGVAFIESDLLLQQEVRLQIFTMNGAIIYERINTPSYSRRQLPINNLPTGNYVVRVVAGEVMEEGLLMKY